MLLGCQTLARRPKRAPNVCGNRLLVLADRWAELVNWTDLHTIPQSTWSTYSNAATPAKNKATDAQAIATSVRLDNLDSFLRHDVTQSLLKMVDVKRKLDGLNKQHNYTDSSIKILIYQLLNNFCD